MRKIGDLIEELDPYYKHFVSPSGIKITNPFAGGIVLDLFTYDLVASPSVSCFLKEEEEYNPFHDDDI